MFRAERYGPKRRPIDKYRCLRRSNGLPLDKYRCFEQADVDRNDARAINTDVCEGRTGARSINTDVSSSSVDPKLRVLRVLRSLERKFSYRYIYIYIYTALYQTGPSSKCMFFTQRTHYVLHLGHTRRIAGKYHTFVRACFSHREHTIY